MGGNWRSHFSLIEGSRKQKKRPWPKLVDKKKKQNFRKKNWTDGYGGGSGRPGMCSSSHNVNFRKEPHVTQSHVETGKELREEEGSA